MSNPTSNFGWVMPTSTDLVTDLPADFAVFGQGVDTTMADLKGGTTGQILSKATNTDMDFVWTSANPGDITGVTAGTGLSGGGTSGDVTVSINTAVTADLTTAQTLTNKKLSDSTTTIVDVTDATKAIKFDVAGTTGVTGTIATAFTTAKTVTIPDTTGTVALTNGVVNNTLTTTTGDTIYASSANTPARLGIGSTGQVLTVAGGVPTWATASSGGMTQIATGNLTGAAVTISSIPATYNSLRLTLNQWSLNTNGKIGIITNNDTSTSYTWAIFAGGSTSSVSGSNSQTEWQLVKNLSSAGQTNQSSIIDFPLYNNADNLTATALTGYRNVTAGTFDVDQSNMYRHSVSPVLNRIDILATISGSYTFDNGTYTLWGIK